MQTVSPPEYTQIAQAIRFLAERWRDTAIIVTYCRWVECAQRQQRADRTAATAQCYETDACRELLS